MTRALLVFIFLTINMAYTSAQVTGGRSVFLGATLENSPRVTALGGYVVSNPSSDVNFIMQNPALMDSNYHNQLGINFFDYYIKTNSFSMAYSRYRPELKTNFGIGLIYNDYGILDQTDDRGNITDHVFAADFALQLSASRYYGEHWTYGASIKWASARLASSTSNALMMDAGINYVDSARGLTFGAVAKNIGFQIKKFSPGLNSEPVPFDFQLGVTKKFEHIPFRFGVTAHHFFNWDIRYDNPADAKGNSIFVGTDTMKTKSYFFDKLFRHLIFTGEVLLSDKINFIVSYNHLRRSELSIVDARGLSGFGLGMNLNYKKWSLLYAKSFYNQIGGTNHIGLNLNLNEFF